MEEVKLLPCPFCGATPTAPRSASVENISWDKHNGWKTASIRCPKCSVFVLGDNDKPTDRLAVKEAARVWNTRTE